MFTAQNINYSLDVASWLTECWEKLLASC